MNNSPNQVSFPLGIQIPIPMWIVDGSGNQITSFGGGTQYTDGGTPPTHPVGGTIEFNNSGTWATVSASAGLPVNIVAGSSSGTQYTDGNAPPTNPIGTAIIFDQSGTWKDVGADQPLPITGTVNTLHGSAVDSTNSSTATLTANSVFTGTSQSSLNYTALSIEVFADQASAAGGLSIQQSQNGTNWDTADTFTISASTAFNTVVNLIGSKYRVVYTNGGTNQGVFRLQTITQTQDVVLPRTLTAAGNLKVDGSGATQPISAASLPLPAGAATAAKQPALGTAGSASADVITIQGIASMTKLLVTPDSVALPANQSVNTAQLAGTTTSVNNGTTDAGTQRVTLSSDSTGQVKLATGVNTIGALTANQSINNVQINGNTMSVDSGTSGNGTQRVIQAGAATGTKSNVASSATSVTILASNTSRKGATVYNDSTQLLYLDTTGGTASSSSYGVQVPSQQYFELPGPTVYNGAITGIWVAANGNARVVEWT